MRIGTRKRNVRAKAIVANEHHRQSTFFKMVRERWPNDLLIYAVPNHGVGYAFGLLRAAKSNAGFALMNYLRAEGFTDGIPDVNVDHARGKYTGMRIEFKKPGNGTSDSQNKVHAQLRQAGHLVLVHIDPICAFMDLIDYLNCNHERFDKAEA